MKQSAIKKELTKNIAKFVENPTKTLFAGRVVKIPNGFYIKQPIPICIQIPNKRGYSVTWKFLPHAFTKSIKYSRITSIVGF
ncbi:MAG: hypothetical protein E2O79_06455 [Caldithrix sp.]|nr:MAG: hypothetical protein E2O79_06455 [Caldithrix sp.]